MSDRIARVFNRSATTRAVALDIFKAFQSLVCWSLLKTSPAGNYMIKVNNRNTRKRCEICSKLTIKARFLVLRFFFFINTPDVICNIASMLMILLSPLSKTRYLICGNN